MGIFMTEGGGNWRRKWGEAVKVEKGLGCSLKLQLTEEPGQAPSLPRAPKGVQSLYKIEEVYKDEEALLSSSQINPQHFCQGKSLQQEVAQANETL